MAGWLARFYNSARERARFVLAQRSPRGSHLARDAFLESREQRKKNVCEPSASATSHLTRLARGKDRKDGKCISLSSFPRADWHAALCNFRVAGKNCGLSCSRSRVVSSFDRDFFVVDLVAAW
jgi:hypothetical protein